MMEDKRKRQTADDINARTEGTRQLTQTGNYMKASRFNADGNFQGQKEPKDTQHTR